MRDLITVNDGEALISEATAEGQTSQRITAHSSPMSGPRNERLAQKGSSIMSPHLSNAETVDLPLAMPPVNPTTRMMARVPVLK
jgi:hypothetical protein